VTLALIVAGSLFTCGKSRLLYSLEFKHSPNQKSGTQKAASFHRIVKYSIPIAFLSIRNLQSAIPRAAAQMPLHYSLYFIPPLEKGIFNHRARSAQWFDGCKPVFGRERAKEVLWRSIKTA
jgi:hypothetical protein